ncbi:MAG: hypothetical protein HYZ65_07240 [Burkholderiales bacterium]|nr:hypothetical protein [Burkholderiales bacterium]
MNRWFWICPILLVLLSVTVIFYWGWSWTSILVTGLALVCPALIIWGVLQLRKRPDERMKK